MATLFQRSTIGALLAGIFDGDETVRELLKRGDFGLGTFNALDGEMVVLDGACYHVRSDGSAVPADPDSHTPFAAVTRFTAEHRFRVEAPTSRAELARRIDEAGRSTNTTIAVRIVGLLSNIRTRTVSAQTKPYPSLEEASRHETEIELTDVDGTLVGFRTPEFEHSIGVAGYHLHFLDDKRTRGGHVLDFILERGEVELMELTEIHLSLPATGAFLTADLDPADAAIQIRHAEGN
jgi:acetolactate decarboxylase